MKRRQLLKAGAAMWPLGAVPRAFAGDAYPARSVRLVVPVSPGGSADKLARTIAQHVSEQWPHRVVVENVPGASSTIGTAQVAKAAPDGYTLLLGGDSLAINVALPKGLTYDPLKDLTGVVKAVVNPQLLLVRPGLGVKDFAGFAALVRSRPGEITLGLPGGKGSSQHLAVELLNQRLGTKTNNIPYPGGGPVLLDMLGGHIDATLITLAAATEHVRAGKLVPLAVTTSERSRALPDVPTVQQAGLDGYVVESWQGIVAPAATPKPVIEKLNRDVVAVLRRPDVASQLEQQGFAIAAGSPADVDETVRRDSRTYTQLVASAGIVL